MLLFVGVLITGLTGQVYASHVILVPGATETASDEAVPTSIALDSVTVAFDDVEITGIKGTLYHEVRRDPSDGYLIFTYRIDNTGPVNNATYDVIARLSTTNFSGFSTAVAYDGATVPTDMPPEDFTRSPGGGSTVGFDFPSATGLPKGDTSPWMWIKTDAYVYTIGSSSIIDGATVDIDTFSPTAGTPEPSTMILFGVGLLGFGGRVLRKKRV